MNKWCLTVYKHHYFILKIEIEIEEFMEEVLERHMKMHFGRISLLTKLFLSHFYIPIIV